MEPSFWDSLLGALPLLIPTVAFTFAFILAYIDGRFGEIRRGEKCLSYIVGLIICIVSFSSGTIEPGALADVAKQAALLSLGALAIGWSAPATMRKAFSAQTVDMLAATEPEPGPDQKDK